MSIIAKFLHDLKNDPEIGDIGSTDYPIQFKDTDHNLRTGYISGAKQWTEGEYYFIEVYIMTDEMTAFTYENKCVAPQGCHINWDNLVCATQVNQ